MDEGVRWYLDTEKVDLQKHETEFGSDIMQSSGWISHVLQEGPWGNRLFRQLRHSSEPEEESQTSQFGSEQL